MTVFAVSEPPDVRIEIQVGRVDLVATDRDDVVVTVSPSNPGRSGDRSAAEAVRVDRAGGAVRIIGPSRLNLFGPGDSVDVLVEVPGTTTATVDVKYGSVNASGALAVGRVNLSYGDLTLESAAQLDLSVGHGEVRVTRVTGDAEVRLKSGSARLGRIDDALRLSGSTHRCSSSHGRLGGHHHVQRSGGARPGRRQREGAVGVRDGADRRAGPGIGADRVLVRRRRGRRPSWRIDLAGRGEPARCRADRPSSRRRSGRG